MNDVNYRRPFIKVTQFGGILAYFHIYINTTIAVLNPVLNGSYSFLDRPSVSGFLHMGLGTDYTCEPDETVLGVPSKKFKAHVSYTAIGAELDLTYHWSSKSKPFDHRVPISALLGLGSN